MPSNVDMPSNLDPHNETTPGVVGVEGLPVVQVQSLCCAFQYSELPLIWTPEMSPLLYSGHFKMSQSMLPSANLPLK